MLGCEIAVWLSYVLELSGCRVDYLDIAGDIFVSVYFTELIERLVSNVSNVELVIAYSIVRTELAIHAKSE